MNKAIAAAVFIQLLIMVLLVIGWVLNIVALAQAATIGGLEAARIIGIIIVPLGGILGWV